MPEGYPAFCQVVRRQLNGHPVPRKHLDIVLAHLAGQMSQHFVALGDLNLERSVPHTLNYGSIDGDHIFFWNGAYLLFERGKVAGLAASCGIRCNAAANQRDARVAL